MADKTQLDANLATLSAKVDELVTYKTTNPPPVVPDNQAEIDEVNNSVLAILARIP